MDNSGAKTTDLSDSRLTPVESEVIELFVQFARALSLPRSYAEIYGLLFISPSPLTQSELEERLQISKGSTSMGLNFLENLGAVRAVQIRDHRRTHYQAVAELRHLVGSFLRQHVLNNLNDSGPRLERIREHSSALTGEAKAHAHARLELLKSWCKNSRRALPFLLKILGDK